MSQVACKRRQSILVIKLVVGEGFCEEKWCSTTSSLSNDYQHGVMDKVQ